MSELKSWQALGKILYAHGSSNSKEIYSLGITQDEFDYFESQIYLSSVKNGWFTSDNIRFSLLQISIGILSSEFVDLYHQFYSKKNNSIKVAVIMAGNIPLVGFHDFITVLISGHSILVKLSSEDDILLKAICNYIYMLQPNFENRIQFCDRNLGYYDAIIATGNETSNESFRMYFGKKYHLFRGHRTSIAILSGDESTDELQKLGEDIFTYFGRGCRNVTHLCLPEGFNVQKIFENIIKFSGVIQNKKYGNNYDYNKAMFLLNQTPFLDNNFILLRETEELFAPIAVLNYHFYHSDLELKEYLHKNNDKIQCKVGMNGVPFGQAQCPKIIDFADGVNTFDWLSGIPQKTT